MENFNKNDLISAIMPTYKRGEMIIDAIDSVLHQTYPYYEIIIVDDCSPDNTARIISEKYANEPKVKYYKNEHNSGAGVTRKNGYKKSSGNYLVFMDDDDYYTDNEFFEKAMKVFKSSEEPLSFVSANSSIKYEVDNTYENNKLNVLGKVSNIEYLKGFQTTYEKPNSTFTTIFKKSDIYDLENVEMLNDSSIYMRALLKNPVYILEDSIGVYRVHDKNMSFNIKLDFLLENLDEKKKIGNIIKERNLMPEKTNWLYEQVMLTARYYIVGSKPSKENFDKLLLWCKQNVQSEKLESELTNLWLKGKA